MGAILSEGGRERLVFFSDAVFAIAITLLVLELRIPENVSFADGFAEIWQQMTGFIVSFGVIGLYWLAHHALFERVARVDVRALRLNLLLLMTIAFLPFPTAAMSGHVGDPDALRFYALAVIAIACALALLVSHLMRPPFVSTAFSADRARLLARACATIPVFAASIALAGWRPGLAMLSWALTLPAIQLADKIWRRPLVDVA